MTLSTRTRQALNAMVKAALAMLFPQGLPLEPVHLHLNLPQSKHRHPPEWGTGGRKQPRKNRKSSLRARRRAKRNRHKRR